MTDWKAWLKKRMKEHMDSNRQYWRQFGVEIRYYHIGKNDEEIYLRFRSGQLRELTCKILVGIEREMAEERLLSYSLWIVITMNAYYAILRSGMELFKWEIERLLKFFDLWDKIDPDKIERAFFLEELRRRG